MELITIEEKSELASGLRARIDELKKTISLTKKLGFDASYFEQCLTTCETLIKENKIWRLI